MQLELIEAAAARTAPDVKAKLAAFNASLPKDDALAKFQSALAGGDRDEGERLFKEHAIAACLRCHQVSGSGGEAGPDLTTIASRKDRRYILESIVAPNAQIADGFQTVMVTMKNGEIQAGVIKGESDSELILQMPEAAPVKIAKSEIKSRENAPSGMLPNLGELMTKRGNPRHRGIRRQPESAVTSGGSATAPCFARHFRQAFGAIVNDPTSPQPADEPPDYEFEIEDGRWRRLAVWLRSGKGVAAIVAGLLIVALGWNAKALYQRAKLWPRTGGSSPARRRLPAATIRRSNFASFARHSSSRPRLRSHCAPRPAFTNRAANRRRFRFTSGCSRCRRPRRRIRCARAVSRCFSAKPKCAASCSTVCIATRRCGAVRR